MSKATFIAGTLLLMMSIVVTANPVYSASKYYSSVQQICNAYQVAVDYNRMSIAEDRDGSTEFTIEMNSARNQFDRVMLVGFYAAGKALEYHGVDLDRVKIIISVEYKGTENIVAVAEKSDIKDFVKGKLSSRDFIRKVSFD